MKIELTNISIEHTIALNCQWKFQGLVFRLNEVAGTKTRSLVYACRKDDTASPDALNLFVLMNLSPPSNNNIRHLNSCPDVAVENVFNFLKSGDVHHKEIVKLTQKPLPLNGGRKTRRELKVKRPPVQLPKAPPLVFFSRKGFAVRGNKLFLAGGITAELVGYEDFSSSVLAALALCNPQSRSGPKSIMITCEEGQPLFVEFP